MTLTFFRFFFGCRYFYFIIYSSSPFVPIHIYKSIYIATYIAHKEQAHNGSTCLLKNIHIYVFITEMWSSVALWLLQIWMENSNDSLFCCRFCCFCYFSMGKNLSLMLQYFTGFTFLGWVTAIVYSFVYKLVGSW